MYIIIIPQLFTFQAVVARVPCVHLGKKLINWQVIKQSLPWSLMTMIMMETVTMMLIFMMLAVVVMIIKIMINIVMIRMAGSSQHT